MMILVSEWMLSYQLSILTIKSPKNFSLFLSWWNSFTKKNRHRRHDKTRERCIRSKDPLLSAKLWGQRLQPGGATWMRRIPFPISPKEISFLCFKMIFGIPFKPFFPKTLTRQLKGGCLGELSICNCSRPPFRLPGAVTPVTPVNAPLVGLAPRVQEIWWLWENLWNLCQGSVELEHISYWHLLTIDLRKPNRKKQICFVWGVCEWAEWMDHCCFFWGWENMYIYIYVYVQCYIFTLIFIYLAQYELLIAGNITFCTSPELLHKGVGWAYAGCTRLSERWEGGIIPPKTRHDFIWVVCAPWPVIKKVSPPMFCLGWIKHW